MNLNFAVGFHDYFYNHSYTSKLIVIFRPKNIHQMGEDFSDEKIDAIC
jgi:hypothetical protein